MISIEQAKYIAGLARMNLSDQELKQITRDLESILDYIKALERLDCTNVKPTSHVLPLHNVYREDKVRPSLSQGEVLGIAVQHHKGAFRVPQVVE